MQGVWIQEQIELRARPRGFHLVTSEILDAVPELESMSKGIAVVFMQHTSASLTINENASPDVRRDFAEWFDRAVPDGAGYFAHTLEGPDDMPAHIKASLTGASLTIPVAERLAGARDVAGRLPLRVPRQRRPPPGDVHGVRRITAVTSAYANMCSCAGTT